MSFIKRWLSAYRDFVWALLIATVVLLPLAFGTVKLAGVGGVYPSISSDEEHYVSLVREVSEGRVLHRNPYIFEEKTGNPNIYMFGEWPLGLLFRVWPFGVGWFVLAMKWIGVSASAYVLFKILARLKPEQEQGWRIASVLGFLVLGMLLGPSLLGRAWQTLLWQAAWQEGLPWVRFVNPVITGVGFLAGIWLFIRAREERAMKLAVAFGLLSGLMSWFYIYFWIVLSVLAGLWFMEVLVRERSAWRRPAASICLVLICSVPYVILVAWEMAGAGQSVAAPTRTHVPLVDVSFLAAAIGYLGLRFLASWRKRSAWSEGDTVLTMVALAAVLGENQHVLTGRSLQPHHFYFLINLQLGGLFLVLLADELAGYVSASWRKRLGIGAAVLLFWLGFSFQGVSIRNTWNEFADRERFVPAFALINQQPLPDVVLADDRAAELIPMYTGADVAFAPHAAVYESTSPERRKWAWFVRSRLSGLTDPDLVEAAFRAERDQIGAYVFEAQYWRDRCGSYGCFPDDVLLALVKEYRDFLTKEFGASLQAYRVNRVLWDERRHPEWDLGQFSFLVREWQGDGVSLWTWAH
jgi:hypothetical protein